MIKPFIKWAGGKTQLLKHLIERMPASYNQYVEPMIGGGALYFSIQPTRAIISDANEDLILLYRVIQNNVEALISDLRRHQNTKEYFDSLRSQDRLPSYEDLPAVQKASRTLFLNRTCFNGLYRVNKLGQFNVPYGKYVNPYIPNDEHLRACSAALRNCQIINSSFDGILPLTKSDDFVYLDPPYLPISQTAKFTEYTRVGFGYAEHVALRNFCRDLDRQGTKFMLSNACSPTALALYDGWNIDTINAPRSIAAKGTSRQPALEIIVRNYE